MSDEEKELALMEHPVPTILDVEIKPKYRNRKVCNCCVCVCCCPWWKRAPVWLRTLVITFSVIVTIMTAFLLYTCIGVGYAMPEALAMLKSDSVVQVDTSINGWSIFYPTSSNSMTNSSNLTIGIIFYPGGKVDSRAYAPFCNNVVTQMITQKQQRVLCVIIPMPLNLAIFNINAAKSVQDYFSPGGIAVSAKYPGLTDYQNKTMGISKWIIGGHSLGGAMACSYIGGTEGTDSIGKIGSTSVDSAGKIFGLLLLGSACSNDISTWSGNVTACLGSNDGLESPQVFLSQVKNVPSNIVVINITGGNHGQFGYYGDQPGDNKATISRQLQDAKVTNATIDLLMQT
ncbi:hypothetical protein HK096_008073 [Nowakowskiella sp. JEL0078]|nr:hypothetical protein HK096_008073 [Nowakowskiella sp. JEL0078]